MVFRNDDLSVSLDSISREIISGLPSDLGAPGVKDAAWTKAVEDGLRRIGKNLNLFVCCHGSKDQGEWLLDVTWMIPNDCSCRIVLVSCL